MRRHFEITVAWCHYPTSRLSHFGLVLISSVCRLTPLKRPRQCKPMSDNWILRSYHKCCSHNVLTVKNEYWKLRSIPWNVQAVYPACTKFHGSRVSLNPDGFLRGPCSWYHFWITNLIVIKSGTGPWYVANSSCMQVLRTLAVPATGGRGLLAFYLELMPTERI